QPMPREAGDAAGPWRRPLSYLSPQRVLSGADASSLPVFFVHADHLGSAQALTKADGTLLCQEQFFAYGRSSDRRDARARYRYIGVERDEETGLCMTGPRTYDALAGRFHQPDQAGTSCFEYSHNRPLGRSDPNGYQDSDTQTVVTYVAEGQEPVSSVLGSNAPTAEAATEQAGIRNIMKRAAALGAVPPKEALIVNAAPGLTKASDVRNVVEGVLYERDAKAFSSVVDRFEGPDGTLRPLETPLPGHQSSVVKGLTIADSLGDQGVVLYFDPPDLPHEMGHLYSRMAERRISVGGLPDQALRESAAELFVSSLHAGKVTLPRGGAGSPHEELVGRFLKWHSENAASYLAQTGHALQEDMFAALYVSGENGELAASRINSAKFGSRP
ncbi:MAG: RHS repeat-associated core domain-containing protein, partial [Myxococcota bacterium]